MFNAAEYKTRKIRTGIFTVWGKSQKTGKIQCKLRFPARLSNKVCSYD